MPNLQNLFLRRGDTNGAVGRYYFIMTLRLTGRGTQILLFMEILDIHSHHEGPQTVMSLSAVDLASKYADPSEVTLTPGQAYSIGIHPWDTAASVSDAAWMILETLAKRPEVVAIGECGVDTLKGGAMFKQLLVFKRQLQLAESIAKPMIIHDVKAHDILIGLHRDLAPKVKWAIHGFRYKPTVAEMFTSRGIYLSLGEQFNTETLAAIPRELLLAETDESPKPIADIVAALSAAAGTDLTPTLLANAATFLG